MAHHGGGTLRRVGRSGRCEMENEEGVRKCHFYRRGRGSAQGVEGGETKGQKEREEKRETHA